MQSFFKCFVPIAVVLALVSLGNSFPVEEDYSEEQTVPILKPGPYSEESYDEAHLASEDQTDEFTVPEEEDPEEFENDSGFHHDQGNNRPDGARKSRRLRRSPTAQEGDDTEYVDEDDEWGYDSWEWDDSENQESGNEDDYELPTYSDEETEYENENDAINNGEFDNEEEVGADEDGALLRLMHGV